MICDGNTVIQELHDTLEERIRNDYVYKPPCIGAAVRFTVEILKIVLNNEEITNEIIDKIFQKPGLSPAFKEYFGRLKFETDCPHQDSSEFFNYILVHIKDLCNNDLTYKDNLMGLITVLDT